MTGRRTAVLSDLALVGPELTQAERPCILVEDGVILDILTRGAFEEIRDSVDVIDLGSRTLLPGLFECHNHLALDARLPGHLGMMGLSEAEHTVLALNGLHDDLMSGVTTARCMGDRYYLDVTMKRLIKEGKVEGPDLLVSGIGMKAAHGHGFVGLPHSGAEEFRKTARENMFRGVDHLKIFMTPGAPAKSETDFIPCYLTREEVATVVQEGRSVGIPATAHCIGGQGLDLCIEEGVYVIDHLYSVTEKQVRRLETEFDGWVDMTSGIVLDPEREPYLSEASVAGLRAAREYSRACMNRIYSSGKIRFTIGTDANHGLLWKELLFAEQGGASRKTALKAVTINAAEMCGVGNSKGRIAPGYQADLIAVSGNPLEDLSALSQVPFVMKRGTAVKTPA